MRTAPSRQPQEFRKRLLGLSGNRLTGPIPPELGRLTNLERLQLHENGLSGPIPPELGQLANLIFLSLSINELSGPIPPELGQLTILKRLWLHGNQSLLRKACSAEFLPEAAGRARVSGRDAAFAG